MSEGVIPKAQASLRLEIPIDEKDATRRGIDPSLCKLVVSLKRDGSGDFLLVARLAEGLRPTGKAIFVTAVGEFVSLVSILPKIQSEGAALFTGHNITKITSVVAMESILSLWKSEALVIFLADDETANKVISGLEHSESRWWQFTKGGYERSYLNQISYTDPFLFFSESHMSLEVIGNVEGVLRCFNLIRASE